MTAWPSFISYVLDTLKLGAVPQKVPLVDDHYDVDALPAAIGPRTKLVYIATPNNPTGTMTTRSQLDAYFDRVPEHVLAVPIRPISSTSSTRTTRTAWRST